MASRRDDSDGEDIDDDEDYQVDDEDEDDTGKRRSSRIAKPAGPRGSESRQLVDGAASARLAARQSRRDPGTLPFHRRLVLSAARTSTRLKAPAGVSEAVEKKSAASSSSSSSSTAKQQTYTEGTCWFCGDGRSRTHNMIVMCSECNIGYQ